MKKNVNSLEGKLIDVPPGSYLRQGSTLPTEVNFSRPVKGLVVKVYSADWEDDGDQMLQVLAEGELINIWQAQRGPNNAPAL